MKTNQVLESCENRMIAVGDKQMIIRQRTKDSFFALSDIVLLCDSWFFLQGKRRFDIHQYFKQEFAKEFLAELEFRMGFVCYIKGKKNHTGWVHPFLMLDILLWANPKFKVEVYSWLNDFLIQNRINSGDSFNRMCGVLWKYNTRKEQFAKEIKSICNQIKDFMCVSDWNKASQEQLRRRDELQNFIADLAETLQDSKESVRLGFVNYRRKYLGENTQITLKSEVTQ